MSGEGEEREEGRRGEEGMEWGRIGKERGWREGSGGREMREGGGKEEKGREYRGRESKEGV